MTLNHLLGLDILYTHILQPLRYVHIHTHTHTHTHTSTHHKTCTSQQCLQRTQWQAGYLWPKMGGRLTSFRILRVFFLHILGNGRWWDIWRVFGEIKHLQHTLQCHSLLWKAKEKTEKPKRNRRGQLQHLFETTVYRKFGFNSKKQRTITIDVICL